MKKTMMMASLAVAGAAVVLGQMNADAVATAKRAALGTVNTSTSSSGGLIVEPIGGGVGPDVSLGAIQSIVHWTAGGAVNGIQAYSVGTTSCNIGTANLNWIDGTNQHPLIGQNMFRLSQGRFEQIGQSWLKFSFCALQQNLCGACNPVCGGCCSQLGPGCSDPYTASRNGSPSLLGPKDLTINPATAAFVQAHQFPQGPAQIAGRLQVAQTDLQNALFPQSRFFIDGVYLTPDDAAAGNDNNNGSWREVVINQTTFAPTLLNTGTGAPGGSIGGTNREEVALFAWQEFDTNAGPAPNQPVTIVNADIPGDGRLMLAYEVTNNNNGTWTYEYLLYNFNSDRCASSFSVPVPAGVNLSNLGFHDNHMHSFNAGNGSMYDHTDWTSTVTAGAGTASWSTSAFVAPGLANAIRFGTGYNFRFTANTAPQAATVTVGLYKPGAPASININAHGPQPGPICVADLDGSGEVDGVDLGILLSQWAGDGTADFDGNNVVDGIDLGFLLNEWGDC